MSKETKEEGVEKIGLADLKHRHELLGDGLQDFLDDNNLHLSDQNFERTRQHLISATAHFKDLTLYDVTNYLQQTLEHHEHVIETMNKTGLAEESLIKLIITAESDRKTAQATPPSPGPKPWKFSLKSLPLPVAVSLVLLLGFAFARPFMPSSLPLFPSSTQDPHNEIGASSVQELKDLAKQVVEQEKASGHTLSTATLWNKIKALDATLPVTAINPAINTLAPFNTKQPNRS